MENNEKTEIKNKGRRLDQIFLKHQNITEEKTSKIGSSSLL